jgi:hypothetical protein
MPIGSSPLNPVMAETYASGIRRFLCGHPNLSDQLVTSGTSVAAVQVSPGNWKVVRPCGSQRGSRLQMPPGSVTPWSLSPASDLPPASGPRPAMPRPLSMLVGTVVGGLLELYAGSYQPDRGHTHPDRCRLPMSGDRGSDRHKFALIGFPKFCKFC